MSLMVVCYFAFSIERGRVTGVLDLGACIADGFSRPIVSMGIIFIHKIST